MNLKDVFEGCAEAEPLKGNLLRGTSLALRRGGIHTMEQLQTLYHETPELLYAIRDIGPRRIQAIGELLRCYERQEHPDKPGEEPVWTE